MSYDYTYDYTRRAPMRQNAPNVIMKLYYAEGHNP
jgi:hypothetical protein